MSPALVGGFFTTELPGMPHLPLVKSKWTSPAHIQRQGIIRGHLRAPSTQPHSLQVLIWEILFFPEVKIIFFCPVLPPWILLSQGSMKPQFSRYEHNMSDFFSWSIHPYKRYFLILTFERPKMMHIVLFCDNYVCNSYVLIVIVMYNASTDNGLDGHCSPLLRNLP